MVAIYARVSTAEQVNGYSIEEQLTRMRKYCDAMHWEIYKEYVDAGFSGGNTERPALKNLLQDLPKIDRVLVYKLDRLSRSQKDTLYLIEDVFLKNNIGFVSMTESLDTASPFGIAMIGILAVFAQLEKEQIKERMEMGRAARVKSGKYVGQIRTPIGYEYVDGELRKIAEEAEQVREVYSLALQRFSYREICRKMEGRGHRYGNWNPTTVLSCLKNPVYIGKVAFKHELFEGTHEPIIDEETFSRVQAVVRERSTKFTTQHNAGKATSYLGGLVTCARCGGKYFKRADSHSNPVYCCSNRANVLLGEKCLNKRWLVSELDALVINEVKALALDRTALVKRERKASTAAADLSRIDAQISRLIDLYALGTVPAETLNAKLAELNARRASIQEKPEADIQPIIESFADVIDRGNIKEVRAVLMALIDRIEVDGDDVSIHWKF